MKGQYEKNPKLCQSCEKIIPYAKRRNKFCNHSCAASFTNIGNSKNLKTGMWKKKPCEECGKITDNAKFCSRGCFNACERKKVEAIIEAGLYKMSSSEDTFLRRYVIRKRGHKCESCERTKWMGQKIPIDLHHKNGDSEDHHLTNLALICLNCHGLTDNFGRKNKAANGIRTHDSLVGNEVLYL